MRRVKVRRHLRSEQVLAQRRVEHAILGREQTARVDRLLRILLRALEGGEEMRAGSAQYRSAKRSAELIAAIVLFVDIRDFLAERRRIQRLVAEHREPATAPYHSCRSW